MHKQLIGVVYSTDGGRTVLRTEENWDSNLGAGSVSQDGCVAELSAKFAQGDPIVVYNDFPQNAGIAQLVEQLICNSRKSFCAHFHRLAHRCRR